MKKFNHIILTIATVIFSVGAFAQAPGSNCVNADCTLGGSYGQNPNSPSLGQYGCLYSTPNPYWFAINATSTGSIHLLLTQGGGDIDFAAYGPFSSVSAGCPITPSTPQVDCSYSASGTEYIDINNVSPGQVYIVLVTNYSGAGGGFSITPQGNSTASFNCNINFGATTTSTPATCGMPTGSVTATPNGGYPPYTYSWNLPGNPTTPTVNNVAPGTYTVTITSGNDPVTGVAVTPTTATVTVANQGPSFNATSTPASCLQANNGTATAAVVGATFGPNTTFSWNDANNQTTQVATGLTPGPYTVTIDLGNGCIGTANVNVGFGSVTASATMTQVSCFQGNDGTATVTTTMPGTLSYQWNDAAGQTTNPATNLTAGSYQAVISSSLGCTATANIVVTEIPQMVATFNVKTDVDCHSKNTGILGVSVNAGNPPYSYIWDHSTSTNNVANDLYVGSHTVTITDNKGCVITATNTLTEPDPLTITVMTPDTQICPEANIDLVVQGAGGNGEQFYTYTWTLDGNVIGTGNTINVDPVNTNTTYCVTLTEECNSPQADTCALIYFPKPLVPVLTADKYIDCRPGEFEIYNVTPHLNEVATTYIDFGNNTNVILYNGQDTSVVYDLSATYTLQVTNTSIFGCVYDTVLVDFLKVTPDVQANFYLGGNPGTIYETIMTGHDLSSEEVVEWEWISPFSTPSYSTVHQPKFKFPENVEGRYPVTLIVTSFYGCTDTITIDAIIQDVVLFYVPNTFTPDGDEFNQSWKLFMKGGDIYGFNLKVFNRWGEMVWETNDASVGWDGMYNGKPVPQGMYTWRASIKNLNDDARTEHNGTVNVLR